MNWEKGLMKKCFVIVIYLFGYCHFTKAQTSNQKQTDPVGTGSYEEKLDKQEKRLRISSQQELKKWKQLKINMIERQVQEILGKPKLIQGSSSESVWFYQDIPTNAQPANKSLDAGIKNGLVIFKAVSIEEFVQKETAEHIKEVEKLNERFKTKISGSRTLVLDGKTYRFYSLTDTGPYYYKYQLGDTPEKYSLLEVTYNSRDSDNVQADLTKIATYSGQFNNLLGKYERNLKLLRDPRSQRAPFFKAIKFCQPNWDQVETLISKETCKVTPIMGMAKWESQFRWSNLKVNMTDRQVHDILGEPEKAEGSVDSTKEYYGNVPGYGEICFSPRSGRGEYLDYWIEPFWPAVAKQTSDDQSDSEKQEEVDKSKQSEVEMQ